MSEKYTFADNRPVARFFYKGNHTHPVRRTIIIIESDDKKITGYELREGSRVRSCKNAPIKSYRRDRIAKIGQIDKRRVLRRNYWIKPNGLRSTTLVRSSLKELIRYGA